MLKALWDFSQTHMIQKIQLKARHIFCVFKWKTGNWNMQFCTIPFQFCSVLMNGNSLESLFHSIQRILQNMKFLFVCDRRQDNIKLFKECEQYFEPMDVIFLLQQKKIQNKNVYYYCTQLQLLYLNGSREGLMLC